MTYAHLFITLFFAATGLLASVSIIRDRHVRPDLLNDIYPPSTEI